MSEITRADVAGIFSNLSSRAESDLLKQGRQATFSDSSQIKLENNNATLIQPEQGHPELYVVSSEHEGRTWMLNYTDSVKAKIADGNGTASQTYEMNNEFNYLHALLGVGLSPTLIGTYKDVIKTAEGLPIQSSQGACWSGSRAGTFFCHTIVRDGTGRPMFTMSETTTDMRAAGVLKYDAIMSKPSGEKIGSFQINMKPNATKGVYQVDTRVLPDKT